MSVSVDALTAVAARAQASAAAAITLLQTLHASSNDPTVQGAVDAAVTSLSQTAQALDDAVHALTPAPTPPPVA